MTKNEFEYTILPFIELYWKKTVFMNFPQSKTQQIQLGKLVIFCRQTFVPDSVIILDDNENIIDGFHVSNHNKWKGEDIKAKLEELGVWKEEEWLS